MADARLETAEKQSRESGIPPSSEDRVGQGLLDDAGLCCHASGRFGETPPPGQGIACRFHADGTHRLQAKREPEMFRPTAQSETSNEEMDFFSYSIAHDLRSPLLAIDGLSHILERRCGELLGVEGGRILQAIRQTTARMGRLMDDLLAFSRWGRQEKKVAEIDMAALACEVFSDLDPGRPGLQFRVRPLPPIQADPSMIRQVFRNLISNGLKFTAPKQRAFIEVGGEARFSENHYFVKDNGMGFDMHRANELFNPFCRLHSGQEFAGTGVGLAIVKRIILGHGGRVWAEGVLGEGATFHFALPTQSASGKCWKNEEAL